MLNEPIILMSKYINLIIGFILILILLKEIKSPTIHYEEQKIQVISNEYNDPIFTWDESDRRLVVTSHMRRDAFICMRDQCKLVEEWIGK